jgi:hypothetical protein
VDCTTTKPTTKDYDENYNEQYNEYCILIEMDNQKQSEQRRDRVVRDVV